MTDDEICNDPSNWSLQKLNTVVSYGHTRLFQESGRVLGRLREFDRSYNYQSKFRKL